MAQIYNKTTASAYRLLSLLLAYPMDLACLLVFEY